MDLVAFGTGDVAYRVRTGVPVVQVERRVGGMAFQAYKRPGLRRKVFYVDQRLEIARRLLTFPGVLFDPFRGQALDRKAAGSVA